MKETRRSVGVHGADISTTPTSNPEEQPAEFQRSPLCASTSGPLVSAEWTLGCWRERLRGVLVVGPGTSGPIRSTWPLSRVPVASTQRRPARPRDGLLHEGGGVLARGCAYCTKARPTWSTHEPPPVAPRPRALRPGDAGSHLGDHDRTLPAERAAALAPGKTGPTGVLRCHDIRNSQKS